MNSLNKLIYDVVDTRTGGYVKTNCEMITIIPAGKILTNQEIRDFFGIDESRRDFERVRCNPKFRRFVFDKCVVPDSPDFKLERSFE